ncbi:MAG: hypothetical protein PW947_02285 [Paraburkholderia sp.]|nr:hypothetical protein [Paraburkholderia sp.]MDE1179317.1 hypothetical protein [Paraburkholderia sp.]
MSSNSLIWAAVPHNSDGIVFQIRINHGLQRFHVCRRVLELAFELEPRASDARQLQLFYLCCERIMVRARTRRSTAGSDTVPLLVSDFIASDRDNVDSRDESGRHSPLPVQTAIT